MRKALIVLASILTCTLSAGAQTISEDIQLPDGSFVDKSHVFLEDEDCTFTVDNPSENTTWRLSLYAIDGIREPFLNVLESDEPSFRIPIKSIDWSLCKKFKSEDNRSAYYKGLVQLIISGEPIDEVEVCFNLLPEIPQITVLSFTYKYDWNFDDIYPNGNLVIKIQSKGANRYIFMSTDFFHFEFPQRGSRFYQEATPADGKCESAEFQTDDIDWGTYAAIIAYNQFGSVCSDTICTTDYITDPAILARIEEIRQEMTGTEDIVVESNDVGISVRDNAVIFENGDDITDVQIFDISGKSVAAQTGGDTMDISDLKSGYYIIRVNTHQNKTFTRKFIKS